MGGLHTVGSVADQEALLEGIMGGPYNFHHKYFGSSWLGTLKGIYFEVLYNKQMNRFQVNAHTKDSAKLVRAFLYQELDRIRPNLIEGVRKLWDTRAEEVRGL